jgi:PAS domain S-box-containing protein
MMLTFINRFHGNVVGEWFAGIRWILSVVLLCFFCSAADCTATSASTPHVLVFNSYHPGYSWSDSIMEAIRNEFADAGISVELCIEYMDTQRHPPEKIFPLLEKLYTEKFKSVQPDIVIVSDNNALNFILPRRGSLFPGMPVVFCGINNFSGDLIAGQNNITGVAEKHSFEETIELVRKLHPKVTTVVTISDASISARANLEAFRQAFSRAGSGLNKIELAGLSVTALGEELKNLPNDAVIFHLDYYLDETGINFSVEESFQFIRRHTSLPIYVNTDNKIGYGALGGVVTTGRLQGKSAATMAVRILRGESADSIPVLQESPKRPVFDYKELMEYKIPLPKLPSDSLIINEPQGFYYKYRKIVWLVITTFSMLAVIIALLVWNIVQRRRWAKERGRWATIFESAQWGLAIGDPHTEMLVSVNPAFASMHGGEVIDFIGTPVRELYAPEERQSLGLHIQEAQDKGSYKFESVHLRQDGSSFPVSVDVATIKDEQGNALYRVVNVEDMSLQQIIKWKLDDSLQKLTSLNKLANLVVSSLSMREVAKAALHELVNVTQADFSILYLLHDGVLEPIDSHSKPPFIRKTDSESHHVGVCLCGLAAEGKPVYSDDIHTDLNCTLRECKNAGLQSFAALPLMSGTTIIGVLGLASLKTRNFRLESDFLEALSGQAAMGIQNALLYEQVKQNVTNLEQAVKDRTRTLESKTHELEKTREALQSSLEEVNRAKQDMEIKVVEIERMNKLMVGREIRMIELKARIKEFEKN